jgi:predicted transcriptional regulator of viral defense system
MATSGATRASDERFEPPAAREWRIAQLAGDQHGIVALDQLRGLGLSAAAVRHRVAVGMLHRVHAGVYAVGHPLLTRDGRYIAAVLACGPGAALSHRSAADKIALRPSSRALIDVISRRRAGRRRAGIDAHTSSTLLERDVIVVDAIACTSVARTLLDLAALGPRRIAERAFDQADVLDVLDADEIRDVLERAGSHRGAGVLRAILADHAPASTLTRNDLEERFLAICDAAGLPRPQVNAWLALEPTGYEADFLWREQRLIAEVDGRAVHTTRRAFEHDRRRDQRLMLAGWQVVRFAWQQVVHDPATVTATIGALHAERCSGHRR